MEVVASLSQGRTAAVQCGLFTNKSVPVIFEPPCIINQQDATLAVLCLLTTTSMLYMFRTPIASIIRSTINCNSINIVVFFTKDNDFLIIKFEDQAPNILLRETA